jgi:GTP-binding protein
LSDQESFVIADIPGLIEGAHAGLGMGAQFLRHVERTSVLLHLLDISREPWGGGWRDYETIRRELELFNPAMLAKRQVVAVGKLDLPATRERLKKEVDSFGERGIELFPFSSVTGEGMPEVLRRLMDLVGPASTAAAPEHPPTNQEDDWS